VKHIVSAMQFEFDPAKDEANRFKHGLPLSFGIRVFAHDDHIIVGSNRPEDGEERYKAIGLVDGKLYTVVHVWRGNVVRLISVRRSNGNEQGKYDRHTG
jgi:hypothetical protein